MSTRGGPVFTFSLSGGAARPLVTPYATGFHYKKASLCYWKSCYNCFQISFVWFL